MIRVFLAALALAQPLRAQEALELELRRVEAPGRVRAWFDSLDDFLERVHAARFKALEAASDPSRGEALAEASLDCARAYRGLTGDAAPLKALEGIFQGEAEPQERRDRLFSLKKGSLLRWLSLMEQGALERFGPKGEAKANALLEIKRPAPARFAFVDASREPLLQNGRVVSLPLKALLDSGAGPGLGSLALSSRRLWVRSKDLKLYACLAPTSSQGAVRVRYRERGAWAPDQARLYFLAEVLYELGFGVGASGGEITASLDGSRAFLSAGELSERLATALRAFEFAGSLSAPSLESYLEGASSQEARAARMDRLGRAFVGEGAPGAFSDSGRLAAYLAGEPERERLRLEMSRTLSELGLGEFPPGRPFGRRVAALHYDGVLEAALARGEIARKGRGFVRSQEGILGRMAARALPRTESVFDAALLSGLFPHLRFVGMLEDKAVYLGQWRLERGWLLCWAWQDGASGSLRFAGAERAGEDGRETLSEREALALLRELGFLARLSPPRPGEGAASSSDVWAACLYPGDGGPVIGPLTYDRAKAELGGRVYITPYLAAGDAKAAARSLGVVVTGGAWAAAMAAGARGPVLLAARPWGEAGLLWEEARLAPSRVVGGRRLREVQARSRRVLREGDVLRLDPRGFLRAVEPSCGELWAKLGEALRAYERGASAESLALWASARLPAKELDAASRREMAREILEALRRSRAPRESLHRLRELLAPYL